MALLKYKLPTPQGFRPREELIYDPQYLEDCQNLYLNENGVFEAETFTRTAFGLSVSAQVFVLRTGTYVLTLQADATTDTLYEWNGTALVTKVSAIPSVSRTNLWSHVDFGDYVLFTNGTTILVRDISTGEFSIDNTVFPISNWICSHRGRLHLADPLTGTLDIYSDNLISGDATNDLILIHDGKTDTVLASFAVPGTLVTGLTIANGNLISCDRETDLIYVHEGLTAVITTSFATPAGQIEGIAFDGTNLISCDSVTGKIYIHDGITGAVLSSFDVGAYLKGITVINGNLISLRGPTSLIRIHAGITATITTSFAGAYGQTGSGLANDGTNLISCYDTTLANYKICIHAGVTASITTEYVYPGAGATAPRAVTYSTLPHRSFAKWSKINELTFQNVTTTDMSNLSGYAPMEYTGALLRTEPLKKHVIYYGENGISALTLAGTAGYATTVLHHTGVKDAGSVCLNGFGDGTTAHYFIDTSGDLYVIDASLQVTKLGYKEILSAAHTANPGLIRMNYNIRRDEVLINFYGSDNTYIYGRNGLSLIDGDIESFTEKSGTRIIHAPSAISQDNVLYQTNIIDMGYDGQKYFRGFSAKISSPDTVSVRVNSRVTRTGAWTTPAYSTFDKSNGYFNAGLISGVEFRIEIYVASYTACQISEIEVGFSKINSGRNL